MIRLLGHAKSCKNTNLGTVVTSPNTIPINTYNPPN